MKLITTTLLALSLLTSCLPSKADDTERTVIVTPERPDPPARGPVVLVLEDGTVLDGVWEREPASPLARVAIATPAAPE